MSTRGPPTICVQVPEVLPQDRPVAALPPQLQQTAAARQPGAAQQGQAQLHSAGEDRDNDHNDNDDDGDDDEDADDDDDDHDGDDDANVPAAHRRHAACMPGDTCPAALPATGRSMLLQPSASIHQPLLLHLHPCC